tara:strand:- start:1324 stop:1551 length:228 start_codon:yes stop_codon:yes gene_type:complete
MKSRKLTRREFLNYTDEYYVIDLPLLDDNVQKDLETTVRRHATGWYYISGSYFAFKKSKDREIVKGFLAWEKIAS